VNSTLKNRAILAITTNYHNHREKLIILLVLLSLADSNQEQKYTVSIGGLALE
jgi:hypothetical protein